MLGKCIRKRGTICFVIRFWLSSRNSNCRMACVRVHCLTIVYWLIDVEAFFPLKKCLLFSRMTRSLCDVRCCLARMSIRIKFFVKKKITNEWMSWHWYFQFILYVFFFLESMVCWHIYAINTNKSIHKFLSMHLYFFFFSLLLKCVFHSNNEEGEKKNVENRLVASNKQKNCFYRRC